MVTRIWLVTIGCAIAYYRIGQMEYKKGSLVAILSILISVATYFGLGWSILGVLLAQLGLFVILTVINFRRKQH